MMNSLDSMWCLVTGICCLLCCNPETVEGKKKNGQPVYPDSYQVGLERAEVKLVKDDMNRVKALVLKPKNTKMD